MVGHLTLLVDPGQQGDIVCKYPPRHPKSTKISGFFTFDNKTQCLYNRKKNNGTALRKESSRKPTPESVRVNLRRHLGGGSPPPS